MKPLRIDVRFRTPPSMRQPVMLDSLLTLSLWQSRERDRLSFGGRISHDISETDLERLPIPVQFDPSGTFYLASALLPVGQPARLQDVRNRKGSSRVELLLDRPSPFHLMPQDVYENVAWCWYCVGDADRIAELLDFDRGPLNGVGSGCVAGWGRVGRIDIRESREDKSVSDGRLLHRAVPAALWRGKARNARLVDPIGFAPPYWHPSRQGPCYVPTELPVQEEAR